ncbi:PAS domain-containing protein [Oceanibacterium hippocampi]|uniref:histidine kinase n=1 Tax=Oceanibacterium hippocampi TaxID=745714 RepID=A0A1Y5SDD6_9PROT|nr:PAS domain-containing protein [Oceanibacterium hippocampi]SLN35366.1 Blue-light-activated protein [Oceanibacterium hippocampi]
MGPRYRTISLPDVLDSLDQGIGVFDPDLRLAAWNDRLIALMELPDGLAEVGRPIGDLIRFGAERGDYGAGEPEALLAFQLGAIRRGDTFRHERLLPDGTRLEVVRKPLPGGGACVTCTDITAVRAREHELEERSGQFEFVLDQAPSGICLKDLEGRYLYVNRAFADLYGYAAQRLLGRTAQDLFPAPVAEIHTRLESKVVESGEAQEQIVDAVFADGIVRPILAHKFPIYGEGGRIVGVGTIFTDISGTKRADERIRARDAWLGAILDNAPIEIILKDKEGRIQAVSRNVAEEIGRPPDALIGLRTRDYLPPEIATIYEEADRRVIETGEPYQQEVEESADGKVRTFLNAKFPLRDENGEIIGVCSIVSDVTDQKEAEERFRQAQKMEAVGQLTGGVAHDFNNLLAVIQGNAELISERSSDLADAARPILRAAERGAELTQRLLAFSRRQPLRPRPVDLRSLVAGVEEMLVRTLGETIEIESRATGGLWMALADPGQIENAIINLAINARDAMPNGGRLCIASENRRIGADEVGPDGLPAPGDYVMLSVIDDGLGMSADVASHVFEPFFTTKEVGKGSGLGLSMVYGFAQQSGGHVEIESAPGKGTTVRLLLPRFGAAAIHRVDGLYEDIPLGSGENILLIESDSDLRAFTRRMLEGLGYRVFAVGEAEAATEALEAGTPVDLILADAIPGGGGAGTDIAAAARMARPGLPVLYMSGPGPADAVAPARHAERESFPHRIDKPFRRPALARALRRVLDGEADALLR